MTIKRILAVMITVCIMLSITSFAGEAENGESLDMSSWFGESETGEGEEGESMDMSSWFGESETGEGEEGESMDMSSWFGESETGEGEEGGSLDMSSWFGESEDGESEAGESDGGSSGFSVVEITGPYEIEVTDVECESHGLTLRGKLTVPVTDKKEKFPMAVLTHAFLSTNADMATIAEALGKNGIASVRFDLTGSGASDGAYVDTTLTWQKEDILNELAYVKTLDFVDTDNLFLCGQSQGGFDSAMAAADCGDEINGLILWFPAICIPDDFKNGRVLYAAFDPENIPDVLPLMGDFSVSRAYIEDGMAIDPLTDFTVFPNDVLLIHGTNDTVVPYQYAKDLAEAYPSCDFITIEGAGHGFMGDSLQLALDETIAFVQAHIQ